MDGGPAPGGIGLELKPTPRFVLLPPLYGCQPGDFEGETNSYLLMLEAPTGP